MGKKKAAESVLLWRVRAGCSSFPRKSLLRELAVHSMGSGNLRLINFGMHVWSNGWGRQATRVVAGSVLAPSFFVLRTAWVCMRACVTACVLACVTACVRDCRECRECRECRG